MKVIAVVQHTSAEYLGLIEDHLEGRGIRFRYFRPFTEKGTLPNEEAIRDGLILLGGGPWGSAGTRDVPTLQREVELARFALKNAFPIVGIGLGAQVLAIAAGGSVRSTELTLELRQARRVDDEALGGYLPERYPLVVYSRDAALPPESARVLALDDKDRPALWQIGESAVGFSGHPGFKVAMAEDLIMEFAESPSDSGPALAQLRGAQRAIEDALVPIMAGLVQVMQWM